MRAWTVLSLADVPFTAARWVLLCTISARRLAGPNALILRAGGQEGVHVLRVEPR